MAASLRPSRRREVKGDKHHREREREREGWADERGEGKEAAKRGPTTTARRREAMFKTRRLLKPSPDSRKMTVVILFRILCHVFLC